MHKIQNIFCILFHLFISITISTRISHKRDDTKATFDNERRFPNGSVIGIYTYKDENGNPVYVKYYADDSSYGVELKSLKVIEEEYNQTNRQGKLLSKIDNTVTSSDIFGPADSMSATKSIIAEDFYKNSSYNPDEVLNSYPNKKNKGHNKSDNEYEIFLENILKPSDKYNKEKVRIYVDKNRRKVRKNSYY